VMPGVPTDKQTDRQTDHSLHITSPNQRVYKSSLINLQELSRRYPGYILLKIPEDFLRDKPYNIKLQVKVVMSEDLLFLSFS